MAKGKLTLRNKMPRIRGFNGGQFSIGPSGWTGAEAPPPEMTPEEVAARQKVPTQDLELTPEMIQVLKQDADFIAEVKMGHFEILNGDLSDIVDAKTAAEPVKSFPAPPLVQEAVKKA